MIKLFYWHYSIITQNLIRIYQNLFQSLCTDYVFNVDLFSESMFQYFRRFVKCVNKKNYLKGIVELN